MRLLITADLHYNHPKSRAVAEEVIERMNAAGGDGVLVVGDTAVTEGDALERCLTRFRIDGPKLFVAGNHELWLREGDSYALMRETLPRRVRQLGWQWLQDEPYAADDWAIVGSVGWYDYSLAEPSLGIPRRFYEHKVSPGAAERFSEFRGLFEEADDVSEAARQIVARWNDGRFVRLGRSDEQYLAELLDQLRRQLDELASVKRIIAAVHHLPFRELLPPQHNSQWDFAKAYLGSERIGELLLRYPNVWRVYCGHSHFPAQARIGHIEAINIGSGYRQKTYHVLEL